MSEFQERERAKAVGLIKSRHPLFEGASGGASFMGKPRDFVLLEPEKNLYAPVRAAVDAYYRGNNISFWGGRRMTGHVLSSQVACMNHLFAIRSDVAAVTAVLKGLSKDFIRPLLLASDAVAPAYIQFETVSSRQYLNEGGLTRGTQCTSIDAAIYAEHADKSLWAIPIEWKYTEFYNDQDKAAEGCRKDPVKGKGAVRQRRYNGLIEASSQLKSENVGWYYFEPFYQLMRQTLWTEQVIAHNAQETLKADHYLHVHVIPRGNGDLLEKTYPCSKQNMEKTWRSLLKDQAKYQIVDPKTLIQPLQGFKEYGPLLQYLSDRYWN